MSLLGSIVKSVGGALIGGFVGKSQNTSNQTSATDISSLLIRPEALFHTTSKAIGAVGEVKKAEAKRIPPLVLTDPLEPARYWDDLLKGFFNGTN